MNILESGHIRVIANDVKNKKNMHNLPSIFPPSLYYYFLRELVRSTQPKMAIELGVCGGGGSFAMATGNSYTDVIGIDHANDYPANIGFIRTSCSNFTFWQKDSIDAANDIWDGSIGLLFIDTIHTYERTMAEFNAWRPKMEFGGIVVLDDLFRYGMQEAWDELPGTKLRLDFLHQGGSPTDGGFGVILL